MRKVLGLAALVLAAFVFFKLAGLVLKGIWFTIVLGLRIAVVAVLVLGAMYVYRRFTRKRRRARGELPSGSSTWDFIRGRVDEDTYLRSQHRD